MELFWLKADNKWRNISSVILKLLQLKGENKRIALPIGKSLQFFIKDKENKQIADKINAMLKTKITEGEIITLLLLIKSEKNKWKLGEYNIYVYFNDNTLEITDFEKEKGKEKEWKKEIKLKKNDDIDYKQFINYNLKEIKDDVKWEGVVLDMMDMLTKSVLFCSDNSIWDIWFLQDKRVYFIKWEEVTYDKNFNQIIEKAQKRKFNRNDLQFFTIKMLELAAFHSYWPVEDLSDADKADRKEFIENLQENLRKKWYIDFAVKVEWRKLRVNISYSNGKKLSCVMRVIEWWTPPSMEALWLVWWKNWTAYKDVLWATHGLILVCGPTGSGKSMSLTAMIWEINKTQRKHIISLEDPVEFEHEDILSIIEQKEVWVDVQSYSDWLTAILRQKPQIAILWEIRTWEVMEKGIELASTWHIVFATFHSNDVPSTISRIVWFFPWKEKEKAQELSEFILWIFVQKLVSRKWGWKILIKEICIQTENIISAIKSLDMQRLNGFIETWWKYWMITNDKSIIRLYEEWLISEKTAVNFAKDKIMAKKLTKYDDYAKKD